jgi:hypothetical protein
MLFCTIGVALGRSNTRRKSELSSVRFSDICDKSLHEVRLLSEVYCIMKASCQIDLYQRDGSGDLTLRNDRTRRPGPGIGLGTTEARVLSKIGFEVGGTLVELNADRIFARVRFGPASNAV